MNKNLNEMTLEEIQDWEKEQDNSTDIYKIAARIKNLARVDGRASLTPVGDSLCNVYTHIIKRLYDFADTLKSEDEKKCLYELVKKSEAMPGDLIRSQVGTRGKK
jgi:hypothetical protein